MYYNRTLIPEYEIMLKKNGALRWLFDFVKDREDLDFLTGRRNKHNWISVYRGLAKLLKITFPYGKYMKVDAHETYKSMQPNLYGKKDLNDVLKNNILDLISKIKDEKKLHSNYDNHEEGFHQNILSRRYGICGMPDDDFVIIDKEVVIGHEDTSEKNNILDSIKQNYFDVLKRLDNREFGIKLDTKKLGNELDFLGLDKDGNILIIEYKHGTSTKGIYLSPFQIGVYYDIFNRLSKTDLIDTVYEMLDQKQRIGLINTAWKRPSAIKDIVPVLIISEYNYKSSAKTKYDEILQFVRQQVDNGFLSNIQTYNFTNNDLKPW